MSFIKIRPENIDTFTINTNPHRYFITSSLGATGSVYVFPRRSLKEKEVAPLSSFVESLHNDTDINIILDSTKAEYLIANGLPSGSMRSSVEQYLSAVNNQSSSPRKQKVLPIIRFTPSVSFTSNTMRKLVIKDQLSDYYKIDYPSAHWGYTNYNCLNFFTSSNVPSSSCLLYPNIDNDVSIEGYASGTYVPSGAFSFDFYINPCFRALRENEITEAGTILHLSSTYALSIITGSVKDHNGLPVSYRLLLQLSHSAEIPPRLLVPYEDTNRIGMISAVYNTAATDPYVMPGYANSDLAFFSKEYALKYNNWHHTIVRWGTDSINNGTGSFNVDGNDVGFFVVPSGTISPANSYDNTLNPSVLVVGNFYEGKNVAGNQLDFFFANDPSTRDGTEILNDLPAVEEPSGYIFRHHANARFHDLSIKRYYMSDEDISVSSSIGMSSVDKTKVAFYLPPFFIENSPIRKFVGDHGGILQTPFFEVDSTTNDPFNVAMSFGVNGHYINIENYLKDFANDVFPRVHHMTGTALTVSTDAKEANQFLYEQPFIIRRNTLILPCDDGNFIPKFDLLSKETYINKYVDDNGIPDYSVVNLDNLLLTSSLLFGIDNDGTLNYVNEAIGFTPENPGANYGEAYKNYIKQLKAALNASEFDPGIQKGAPLTIYQRTRDPSSNQITIYDISNLYYGKRILPGSIELCDLLPSGSNGQYTITIKDDGNGNLYRADSLTKHSTWNSVGTVFYDEGLLVIKNPHLYFNGKDGYSLKFDGEQNVHVMMYDVLASAGTVNSSSNPNFVNVPATAYDTDFDKEFVYISNINLHDENYNIIAKTQLAQPFQKRHGMSVLFRIKIDT